MIRLLSGDAPHVPGRLQAPAADGRDRQGRLTGRAASGVETARTRGATLVCLRRT